jgi:hypothetical protein
MGQDSAPYNRTESTKLPYMHVLVRVEMSLLRQSFAEGGDLEWFDEPAWTACVKAWP